jgi:hypothetical protein
VCAGRLSILQSPEEEILTSHDLALRTQACQSLAAFRPGSTAFGFWIHTQTCHCPTNSFAPPSDSLRPEPLLQSQLFQKLNHPFEQSLHHPSSQTQSHSHPPRRWASLRTSTSSTLPQTVNHVSLRSPPPSFCLPVTFPASSPRSLLLVLPILYGILT